MTLDYGIAPPGYRLPDATRLGAVRLQVADLGRSLDYYRRVLGLRLLDRDTGQAALGAEGDGLIQPNTLADDRGLADNDSGAVIDEEVSPDVRGRMNVYAGV